MCLEAPRISLPRSNLASLAAPSRLFGPSGLLGGMCWLFIPRRCGGSSGSSSGVVIGSTPIAGLGWYGLESLRQRGIHRGDCRGVDIACQVLSVICVV